MSDCRVAALQMCSSHRRQENLTCAEKLIRQASRDGAELVVLPENFSCMPRREPERLEAAEDAGTGPAQTLCSSLAAELGIWIVAGTIPLRCDDPARVRAASLVYDDQGVLVARYDKLHLFDVTLESGAEQYRESDSIEPGEAPVVVETVAGLLGLSVCYDLRFPELYRAQVDEGATLFSVPAAFTYETGRAHWQLLLRARAVENQAYQIGAAQEGEHTSGRRTWGHACIVDPWGRVLAEREQAGPGVVTAEVDLHSQQALRERFNVLAHRRM